MKLGMGIFSTAVTSTFDKYVDNLISRGFIYLRIDIPDYQNTTWLNQSKAAVIRAVAKGAKVTWGVSSNKGNNAAYELTAANWGDFEAAVLDAAAWAEANGVYEFQIGNEEELHNDDTTLTDAQVRTNLKTLSTAVQAVYTRGNVSYSAVAGTGNMWAWSVLGLGDIDLIAFNLYYGDSSDIYYASPDNFENQVSTAYGYFGNQFYITEFNLNTADIDNFSTNEEKQADGIYRMITTIKETGLSRAYYFVYGPSDTFGALKANGNYRALWDILIKENGFYTGSAGSSIIRGVSNGKYNR